MQHLSRRRSEDAVGTTLLLGSHGWLEAALTLPSKLRWEYSLSRPAGAASPDNHSFEGILPRWFHLAHCQ